MVASIAGQAGVVSTGDLPVTKPCLACAGCVETADEVEKGRFARPRWPQNDNELPAGSNEIDPIEGDNLSIPDRIGLGELGDPEQIRTTGWRVVHGKILARRRSSALISVKKRGAVVLAPTDRLGADKAAIGDRGANDAPGPWPPPFTQLRKSWRGGCESGPGATMVAPAGPQRRSMSQLDTRIAAQIDTEVAARPEQVRAAVELLDGGATVPFIARYRKEVTGGLDDTQLRLLAERLTYLRELEARRAAILKSIDEQGKLTPELTAAAAGAVTKAELEDLYLPFKPKRRTKAEIARERGLGPLAEAILANRSADPVLLAQAYVTEEVPGTKEALEGARDIVVESLSENAALLGRLRAHMRDKAMLCAKVLKGKEEGGAKFSDYFDHAERWNKVAGHRALAMMRGRDEGFLSLDIEVDAD